MEDECYDCGEPLPQDWVFRPHRGGVVLSCGCVRPSFWVWLWNGW